MTTNLFFNSHNRNICIGDRTSAAPIKAAYTLPAEHDAKYIDKTEHQIRQLERKAKNDVTLRFYLFG